MSRTIPVPALLHVCDAPHLTLGAVRVDLTVEQMAELILQGGLRAPAPDEAASTARPPVDPRTKHHRVHCPHCGAVAGNLCVGARGPVLYTHAARRKLARALAEPVTLDHRTPEGRPIVIKTKHTQGRTLHRRALRLRRKGLCVTCGKAPAAPGSPLCEPHRDARRALAKRTNAARWNPPAASPSPEPKEG